MSKTVQAVGLPSLIMPIRESSALFTLIQGCLFPVVAIPRQYKKSIYANRVLMKKYKLFRHHKSENKTILPWLVVARPPVQAKRPE
jgi:hypothetical protein